MEITKTNNPNFEKVTVEMIDHGVSYAQEMCNEPFGLPDLLVSIKFKKDVTIRDKQYSDVRYIVNRKNDLIQAIFFSATDEEIFYPQRTENFNFMLKVLSYPEEELSPSELVERRLLEEPYKPKVWPVEE